VAREAIRLGEAPRRVMLSDRVPQSCQVFAATRPRPAPLPEQVFALPSLLSYSLEPPKALKQVVENAKRLDRQVNKLIRSMLNNKSKIFCISLQRTGTTSTGQFFKDHGYSVATYGVSKKNSWTISYFNGRYEEIFKSLDFRSSQVFEDDPWWLSDFYRVLYHRFPWSRFILLERDADKWFDSMVAHSMGRTLGIAHIHCTQYQRLKEFHEAGLVQMNGVIDKALPLGEEHREHYTSFYKIRNDEVRLFFHRHDRRRLFNARLEDEELWRKMGGFFCIDVKRGYNIHLHKTPTK
jgi:hypothetical protein